MKIFLGGGPRDAIAANAPPGSFASAVGEKILTTRLRAVPDELSVEKSGSEELLQIRSWRAKADWIPPRTVRYGEAYYRLEACTRCAGARPFQYTLRRLPAGVPGRTVLVYVPE